jgi:hypothetical protein
MGEDAGQFRHLGDPPAVLFALDLDLEQSDQPKVTHNDE